MLSALDCGYRHIDCAAAYGNEQEVGGALALRVGPGKVRPPPVSRRPGGGGGKLPPPASSRHGGGGRLPPPDVTACSAVRSNLSESSCFSKGEVSWLEGLCLPQELSREEVFVTSKLWNTKHHPEDVEEACRTSLARLGLSYLDLYLIHWPMAFQ